MTLETLNEHFYTLKQYHDAQERLAIMRATILGAQKYDGMPHASGKSDKVARLALVLASQEEDVERLEKMVRHSEKQIVKFVCKISDNRTKLIFNLRFCCGLPWSEVADMVGGGNTEEAVKMCCYRYLMSEEGQKI